jgi:L-alanine-DL-glutamate epimerase-like enolase superfamily enzyme
MRIVAIKEHTIRLTSAVRNSSISFDGMTASALAIHTDARRDGKPLIGVAFDSIGRYAHGGLLRERFMPRLLNASPDAYADDHGGVDPAKAWTVMMTNEKPGGHGERPGAVGLLDAALWDLAAKANDVPLWSLLSARYGVTASSTVSVYASGGHYRDTDDASHLRADIQAAIDDGHRNFKIKIGGAPLRDDCARVEAALAILAPGMTLAVDGNGTFSRETALAYVAALSDYPLAWLEEPVHPLDFDLHREIAAECPLPLATGENLFSADDARNLIRHGGLRPDRDTLQFDISLSYGIVEYLRILDDLALQGWDRARCAPHAGHLLALNVVGGLGLGMAETAMDTSGLFGALTGHLTVQNGLARLPDAPGTGLETCPIFHELFDPVLG